MDTENRLSESEVSLLLDTYMYLNYYEAKNGQELHSILTDISGLADYGPGGKHRGEYEILSNAVASCPSFGELQISAQSMDMGFDSGTRACIFQETSTDSVYVVFRGTGDGEWMDNGLGLTEAATIQQQRALSYFEQAVDQGGFTENHRIIVTGHSKGGNKAQYVTMETTYNELIDKCYSIDGQGFSEAAVRKWKERYDKREYDERCGKLHGIYGENDFINALGCAIIPEAHVRYLYTPIINNDIAGYHDIKNMFATLNQQGELVYHGQSNYVTGGPKEWGRLARRLSDEIMSLAPEERSGCAAVIMQLMELGGKKKTGINGEEPALSDWGDFLRAGLPSVASALLFSQEGIDFMESLWVVEAGQETSFAVDAKHLSRSAGRLGQTALKLQKIAGDIEQTAKELTYVFEYENPGLLNTNKLFREESENIKRQAGLLLQMAEGLEKAANIYYSCESFIAEQILS